MGRGALRQLRDLCSNELPGNCLCSIWNTWYSRATIHLNSDFYASLIGKVFRLNAREEG